MKPVGTMQWGCWIKNGWDGTPPPKSCQPSPSSVGRWVRSGRGPLGNPGTSWVRCIAGKMTLENHGKNVGQTMEKMEVLSWDHRTQWWSFHAMELITRRYLGSFRGLEILVDPLVSDWGWWRANQHEANNSAPSRTRRCAFVFKAASLTASLGDNTAWWFQRCLGIKNMGKSPVGRWSSCYTMLSGEIACRESQGQQVPSRRNPGH